MTSVLLNKPTVHQLASIRSYDTFRFLDPIRRWARTQSDARANRPGCRTCRKTPRREISDSQLEALLASLDGAYANELQTLKLKLGADTVVLPFKSGATVR